MTDTVRHRVICDLTPQEYEYQRSLAKQDPRRIPPMLEAPSDNGARFTEVYIGRATADAYCCATGEETSDRAQDTFEITASAWHAQKKVSFMQAAAPHWQPPKDEEVSYWQNDADSAQKLLETFPEIEEHFRETKEPEPAQLAKQALDIVEKMQDTKYNSTRWITGWREIEDILQRIAQPAG